MKNLELELLDEMNAGVQIIGVLELEMAKEYDSLLLRQTQNKKMKRYQISNFKDLLAYKAFHKEHENKIAENALTFDLEICAKSLGKKLTKSLQS